MDITGNIKTGDQSPAGNPQGVASWKNTTRKVDCDWR